MPFVDASGVQVNFPFDPYPCQVNYMEKVVECLKGSVNGILESPTGTGKTLCLLCSSLAWLEDKKAQISSQRWKITAAQQQDVHSLDVYKESLVAQLDEAAGQWGGEMAPPRIIYASRTHSQLTQVIQELKRTAYSHFKTCVLGSREQLCIHPQVMKEENNTTKVHLCRAKVSARSCHFYNNVENAKPNFTNKVLDVEDLVGLGKKHNCCPYYMSRELKNEADIVFLPYNYLLDPKSRRAHGVELNNNIVIFDEAHNLEKICEDSSSFDWSSSDIASAIRDLEGLSDTISEMVAAEESGTEMTDNPTSVSEDFTLKDVYDLKKMLHTLEKEIDSIVINKSEGISKPGLYLFELFSKAELNFTTKAYLGDTVDKMIMYLTNASQSTFQSKGAGLSKFADVIKIAFSRDPMTDHPSLSSHQRDLSKAYKVHIKEENKNWKKKKGGWDSAAPSAKPTRVLSYWCFSPGHAMEELRAQGVKSIILTSGTLSPMDSFMSEMGISFPVQLENPHVIDKNQVWIGVIGKGPDGTILSSSYENRFKPQYQSSLGNAVVNFARVVPNGLLLFFPSYPVMEKSVQHWQENNMWTRVEQYKPIFVEPKGKQDFLCAMENFYEKVHDPSGNGACFAAVCRGKVSEGLDFSDNNGRAVVITGLPFPPRMDPKVILKMQYLEEMKAKGGKGLSGQNWYRQQASRAVNQAIGRVIRHKQDYGAIILCDTRFSSSDSVAQLPSWVRPNLHVYSNFGSALKDMMLFFKNCEKLLPPPKASKNKGKGSSDMGCQGAYFQPSVTRTGNHVSVTNLEKSSAVPAHVPSLKADTGSSSSLAKLKIEYEGESIAAAQPKNLLDALNSASKQHIDLFGEVVNAKTTNTTAASSQAAVKPRKRIVLKKDGKSEVSKDSIQTAEQYLVEVKRTLSVESYELFSTTLSDYKKTEEFTSMISCLADIFTDNPSKYHLFRKFYRFVRPHHKEMFDKMCREILGEGCGYRAKVSTSKKRTSSEAQESLEKKRKEGLDSKFTLTNSEPGTLAQQHLGNKTHLRTEAVSDSTVSSLKQVSSSNPKNSNSDTPGVGSESTAPNLRQSDVDAFFMKNNTNRQVSATKLGYSSQTSRSVAKDILVDQENQPTSKDKEVYVQDTVVSQGVVPPLVKTGLQGVSCDSKVAVMPKPCTEDNQLACENTLKFLKNSSHSGYTCCRCGEDAKIPLKAMCMHVCCMECWKVCIRETKECPKCQKKVKRKHLQRVCFPTSSSS